jgi:membrane associated rhomboid family serine protease/antitoxin component YwqK of YwqJK toxin-antitoxin module
LIEFLKPRAVTIGLIVLNVLVFVVIYMEVGSFDSVQFNSYEFEVGALFNPLTLDGEWYRLFSHMFLHSMFLHLLVNMYGLFSVGAALEPKLGSLKFLLLYLVCGLAGALASLYVSVFTVSVGASGAIFGIFGFSLVMNVIDALESGKSIVGIILNFLVFTIVYVFIASTWNVDHAGHLGGMIAGVSIAVLDYYALRRYDSLTFTLAYLPLLLVCFLILPEDQVHYYQFFEKVRRAEDDSNRLFGRKGLSDNDFTLSVKRNREAWDSAAMALDSLPYVREELQPDTIKLRRYISLRSLVSEYRLRILANETYILMDSIEQAEDSIQSYMQLSYVPPPRRQKAISTSIPETENVERPELVQVWYDSNWIETPYRSVYYRLGIRDSSGQWDGPVRDHYADGVVQMKGVYSKDQRDGIFLYYSHHNSYTSAGRYFENRRVGKWQTFHNNGTLASEVSYDGGFFLANAWDSTGAQQVRNGNGTIKEYYASGALKEEGMILNGKRNGTWTGWYPNGEIHYREEYNNSFVVRGRSRNPQGDTFVYDQSTYLPLPEGGYNELKRALDAAAQAMDRPQTGTVHVYFRVTFDGLITDFEFEKDVSPEVKNIVKGLLIEGPDWRPAREFGYKPVDGYGDVKIEF